MRRQGREGKQSAWDGMDLLAPRWGSARRDGRWGKRLGDRLFAIEGKRLKLASWIAARLKVYDEGRFTSGVGVHFQFWLFRVPSVGHIRSYLVPPPQL
jgi:hypothetical protein